MSGHRFLQDEYNANQQILDPGNGGTIRVTKGRAYVPIAVGAGLETRTLGAPTKVGQRCIVGLESSGGGSVNLTVTGGYSLLPASAVMAYATPGSWAEFISVRSGATLLWRLASQYGSANPYAELAVIQGSPSVSIMIASTLQCSVSDGVIEPTTTNDVDLGSASKAFKNAYLAGFAKMSGAALAALGNSQGTAAPIVSQIAIVSGADATKAVRLPAASAANPIWVINTVAAVLNVYPGTGAQINGGGANALYAQQASKHCLFSNDGTDWTVTVLN